MKTRIILIILSVFVLGLLLGRQIGYVETETGCAKDELLLSVEEMNDLKQQKMDALIYLIRTQMFAAVSGVRRLPKYPCWHIRYIFGNPFGDPVTRQLLPTAENESYPIGEEFFPQHYPPRTSGSNSKR